ncbi:MAG: arginine--tRNA ligase [Candidatus Peribacteraceae bacterium]|jgi:arginyl-tRNA synthetase
MFSTLTAEALRVIRSIAGDEAVVEATLWQFPREPERGDLATSIALSLSKSLKQNPLDIAKTLAEGMGKVAGVERAEATAPGYVNVWLTTASFMEELKEARDSTAPAKTRKKEAPVIIDFCGPNIAKPLGVHHLGSHVIGQAIINLYRHTGANVIGWSYPGDWGTQFGKLAVAFRKWGGGKSPKDYSVEELLALYVRFHDEAEKDPSLEDEARAAFKKIEDGDPELRSFWADVVAVSKEALLKLYERLHLHVDVETGESFYEGKMAPILEEGKKKGVFRTGEGGALIVPFPEEAGMPPLLMQKSDGSTLYATRDLAMIRHRIDEYHPSALYYVVDVAQSMHFKQLFETCRLLGWELPVLEHTLFGRMRFPDTSMSTRKGTALRMEQVLDEAVKRADDTIRSHGESIQTDDPSGLAEMMGIGAVVYGILSQNRKMDIVFDWDKMLSFDGNSAPYLQYTHARARSVLRKAKEGKMAVKEGIVPEALGAGERILLRSLLQFPLVLEEARETRLPHKLTNYLYALCQDFNKFYNTDPILKAEDPARSFRLTLTGLAADILKSGAAILTLRVPDRM